MFWTILYTILGSFNSITYKKACDYAESRKWADIMMVWVNQATEWPLYILIHLIVPASIGFHLVLSDLSISVVFVFLGLMAIMVVSNLACQYAYANEKVSVLGPYSQLSEIFTIILSAAIPFARADTPWWIIVAAIVIALILLGANIDHKNLSFNRYCFMLAFCELLSAAENILNVWLLTKLTAVTTLSVTGILVLICASVAMFALRKPIPIKSPELWTLGRYSFINGSVWCLKTVALYTIIQSESIIFATLLGMLQYAITLVLAYFFLGDRPGRKDIVLGIFVLLSVSGIGIFG